MRKRVKITNNIEAHMNYGLVIKGQSYRVLERGRDYLKIKARGKVVYIPLYVFQKPRPQLNYEA